MEGKKMYPSKSALMLNLGLPHQVIEALEGLAEANDATVKIMNQRDDAGRRGFWVSFEMKDGEEKDDELRRKFMSDRHSRVCQGQVDADDFGRIIVAKGLRYRLVGINRDADKYPLQTEALDGGPSYRFPLVKLRMAKGTATDVEKVIYA
jgi:NAD-specific glutamate dehydrogenase